MNGDAVMKALHALIQKTKAGDFIHGTAWLLHEWVVLGDHANDTTLGQALIDAQRRGVQVRLLLSHPQVMGNPVGTCALLNQHCRTVTCCAPDARHPSASGGSNHAKAWTILANGVLHALLGSMDIAGLRWDNEAHDPCHPRKQPELPWMPLMVLSSCLCP